MKGKKAQFYIIAAFIVIGIILGFLATTQYNRIKQKGERIYDLAEILQFETAEVIDFGIVSKNEEMGEFIESWVEEFVDYAKREGEIWVFIYIDDENVSASNILGFGEKSIGGVGLGESQIEIKNIIIQKGKGRIKIGENLEIYVLKEEVEDTKRVVIEVDNVEVYNQKVTYNQDQQNIWYLIKTETASVSIK